MGTSDESFVSSLVSFSRDLPGAGNVIKSDPALKSFVKKRDKRQADAEASAAAGRETAPAPEVRTEEEERRTVTAEALTSSTDMERRNRRRRASVLTRNFAQPTLGSTGSLGVR